MFIIYLFAIVATSFPTYLCHSVSVGPDLGACKTIWLNLTNMNNFFFVDRISQLRACPTWLHIGMYRRIQTDGNQPKFVYVQFDIFNGYITLTIQIIIIINCTFIAYIGNFSETGYFVDALRIYIQNSKSNQQLSNKFAAAIKKSGYRRISQQNTSTKSIIILRFSVSKF